MRFREFTTTRPLTEHTLPDPRHGRGGGFERNRTAPGGPPTAPASAAGQPAGGY
ncbi:hypothetical protein AB0G74_19990 [Streptomyces sp. NPDC020875]|uniref:hypothetical protein n=1 Tax=Streptomyces sp. NPDC020875 TaxID=3154898 RepID=UPI0033F132B3